jgi:pimeloyl-ACP methyl ester carboxylesterase
VRDRRSLAATCATAIALAAIAGSSPAVNVLTRPGTLAKLPDGRTLNFHCTGSGSPTVILESGWGAGAFGWGRSQPGVAKITRVCSYDRAGYGFSTPGPEPRDGAAIARDLDHGLAAARIKGPFIIVGHSAGGLYARLFAARRPGQVQGFVFLDPTIERLAPPGRDGLDGIRQRLNRCLEAAASTPQPPRNDPRWTGCMPSSTDAHAEATARAPATWRNQLSELDTIFGRTSQQASLTRRVLVGIPAYVITASASAASAPTLGDERPQSLWELQHMALASGFRHGWQRTIRSSHLVQNDRPEVVAEAVRAMVRAARAGVPPPPLAPSETAQPDIPGPPR